jgi:hypothetical protein
MRVVCGITLLSQMSHSAAIYIALVARDVLAAIYKCLFSARYVRKLVNTVCGQFRNRDRVRLILSALSEFFKQTNAVDQLMTDQPSIHDVDVHVMLCVCAINTHCVTFMNC